MSNKEGYGTSNHLYNEGSNQRGLYSYGSSEPEEGRRRHDGLDPKTVEYDDDFYSGASSEYGVDTNSAQILYEHYTAEDEAEDFNDRESVHGILLSILETSFQEHRNEGLKSTAPISVSHTANSNSRTNHREQLEQTWKAIRTHWLWAHETVEERAIGALWKGESNLAPLHLICKLTNNPPTDILEEIVMAAPEVTEWEDDHGWLPIHHACMHGASTEVLKLLTRVHPKSIVALDAHNRTPLHLYATRGTSDHYNPVTLATNFGLLCAVSTTQDDDDDTYHGLVPAEVRDKAGMLPMHYACAYGTTQSVLRVLEEAFPESLEARDDHGRTPLHFVMVNAQRGSSPSVLGYLLGHYEAETETFDSLDGNDGASIAIPRFHVNASVNVRDSDGNLPLHLLNIGVMGADLDENQEKLRQLSECLKLYLDAEPHVSTDFLAALQTLPDLLRDVAVVHPYVRNILNVKIIQRFPTSILVSYGEAYIQQKPKITILNNPNICALHVQNVLDARWNHACHHDCLLRSGYNAFCRPSRGGGSNRKHQASQFSFGDTLHYGRVFLSS